MFPYAKKLVDYIKEDEKGALRDSGARPVTAEMIEPPSHGDANVLQLNLKKKHQMMMLKEILKEAGYDDLAKMSSFSQKKVHSEEE